jgi:hypothetical protein
MALFPKITSACPYKGKLSDILDDTKCQLCKREVHDLSDMSDHERAQFLSSCEENEICVSYRLPVTAVLMATSMISAESVLAQPETEPTEPSAAQDVFSEEDRTDWQVVVVGGLRMYDFSTSLDGQHKRRKTTYLDWDHYELPDQSIKRVGPGAKRGKVGAYRNNKPHND